jgi:hypothetical protein
LQDTTARFFVGFPDRWLKMTKRDRLLAVLLLFLGVGSLFALVPVVMPFQWMVAIHRWLGLGEMPDGPVVEYLARSVSAFYALFGAVFLVAAAHLERYRPLVRFLGIALTLVGLILLGVDIAAGLPWWWSASEGPLWAGVGASMFFLACSDHRECKGEWKP